MAGNAYEHADIASTQTVPGSSRVLDRFPSHFQQPALLWIHSHRFPRRNPPESCVEMVHIFDEPTPFRDHRAGNRWIGMEVPVQIPSIFGDLPDAASTVNQHVP